MKINERKNQFQNRRAKSRKQKKKLESGTSATNMSSMESQIMSQSHMNSVSIANATNLSSLLDVKPKLEQSLHLQHLHAMGMGMTQMGLHHAHPLHSHLPPPPMPPSTVSNSHSSPSPTMMMNWISSVNVDWMFLLLWLLLSLFFILIWTFSWKLRILSNYAFYEIKILAVIFIQYFIVKHI